ADVFCEPGHAARHRLYADGPGGPTLLEQCGVCDHHGVVDGGEPTGVAEIHRGRSREELPEHETGGGEAVRRLERQSAERDDGVVEHVSEFEAGDGDLLARRAGSGGSRQAGGQDGAGEGHWTWSAEREQDVYSRRRDTGGGSVEYDGSGLFDGVRGGCHWPWDVEAG